MNRKEIYKQISEKTSAAEALLREAQKLADETGISFSWEFERDMNGTYTAKVPKGLRDKIRGKTIKEIENMGLWPITTEYIHEWDARYEEEYTSYGKKWGWIPSARSC